MRTPESYQDVRLSAVLHHQQLPDNPHLGLLQAIAGDELAQTYGLLLHKLQQTTMYLPNTAKVLPLQVVITAFQR